MAKPAKTIQAPKGTRDLYPEDVLKRRYIQNAWRDASLRCGFDEIEGPTFESTDLYSIKSGQGILNELFQTFSGKGGQETLDKLVERGQADFALRPEFTPTLARMYAARARQLPKPCKWFTAGPYFRAERPQRGRLREFLQWNCDIIGLPSDEDTPQSRAQMDAEIVECCVCLLDMLGTTSDSVQIKLNDRRLVNDMLHDLGTAPANLEAALNLLDRKEKISQETAADMAEHLGLSRMFLAQFDELAEAYQDLDALRGTDRRRIDRYKGSLQALETYETLIKTIDESWLDPFVMTVVRGLAYYTGTVFEAIADGERAVAGGGRYDNLIELMGGPPTPAVGFAMGDVVLGNLLEDKGLMPEGPELMEAVARRQASIRPVAYIAVPNDDEDNKAHAQSLTASLRRGIESEAYQSRDDRKPWNADRYRVAPMHARISYKSTTNPGKLRADAQKQFARYFIEIHADNKVELTDMDKHESITSPTHGSFSINPADPNYVGAALDELMR